MKQIRYLLATEGDAFLSAIELLSGVSLLLYGISAMAAPQHLLQQDAVPRAASLLLAPRIWQTLIVILGSFQVVCAIHKNPLCSIVTSYPAMAACLYAGLSGVLYGGPFNTLAWFALAWGLVNLLVVRHNKKLWDIRSGPAN